MSSPSRGGEHRATKAETIVVSTEVGTDYVVLLLEALTENLEQPVQKMFYRADPEQARIIAKRLVELADEQDGK